MFARRDPFPFRPAPFPVYAENPGPARLRRWRMLAVVACLLTVLIPLLAGPSNELAIPVSYGRIELLERAPVVLELNLPAAEYQVAPASLGYFAGDGGFVYTADVARGVIFARQRAEVVVLEITAAPSSETYLAQQLALIKQRVEEVNVRQNALLQARRDDPAAAAISLTHRGLWSRLGPDLDGPLTHDWAADLELRTEEADELRAEFISRARHRALLKQLYYQVQAARLQLLLAEFDLQLALARLPRPDFEELVSLGDDAVVRSTVEIEIERLRRAWTSRQAALIRRRATDLASLDLLHRGEQAVPPDTTAGGSALAITAPFTPQVAFPHDPAQPPYVEDGGEAPVSQLSGGPAVAIEELESSLLRARVVVASAELASLGERLAELAGAEQHVDSGGLPTWTNLPRHAPHFERLQLNGLEELADFAMVEQAARRPETALPSLLQLTRSFEADTTSTPGGELIDWSPAPDEVTYGMFVVDRCKAGPVETLADRSLNGRSGEALRAQLDAVIGFPADFDMAQYNLGLLQFLRWYAGLDPAAPSTDEVQAEAVEEPAADGQVEEPDEHHADVDDLFD